MSFCAAPVTCRPFVLAPLADLWTRPPSPAMPGASTGGDDRRSGLDGEKGPLSAAADAWSVMGGERLVGGKDGGLRRVLPLPGAHFFAVAPDIGL